LLLMILNDWVTEPTVVNTVSNFSVSALKVILASGEVINPFFLQAKSMMAPAARRQNAEKESKGLNGLVIASKLRDKMGKNREKRLREMDCFAVVIIRPGLRKRGRLRLVVHRLL